MRPRTSQGSTITRGTLLVLTLFLFAPVTSSATTPIYKCLDQNLGLLYTDEPCKDGELMNIRAGDANPAAVAQLERARDALDRAAMQRIADERHAAAQRDLAAWYAGPEERGPDDYSAGYAPYDYGVAGWSPGFTRHHPRRSRPARPLLPHRSAFTPSPMAHRR